MKQYFLSLFAFDHWANSELLAALVGAAPLPARAPAIFSHLLATTQVWHARLVGQAVRVPVWPDWMPADWPAELTANAARMEQYLHGLAADDFGRPVRYTNTKGEAFETSVSDILTHLLTHASYHQGQVVALLKGSVVPLPDITYIAYVRQLAAHHQPQPMKRKASHLPVLDYLQRQLAGTLGPDDTTFVRYPTRISQTLGFRLVAIGPGTATVALDANPDHHGNQQGTVHGGMLCELADAAIGTAHSTLLAEDESFTSIELKINFFRPVWKSTLHATARPIQHGRTLTHYACDIVRDDGKVAATVSSILMTLRGDQAAGR